MDRTAFRRHFDEFVYDCELSINEEVIEGIVARRLRPLLARIERLEAKVNPPVDFRVATPRIENGKHSTLFRLNGHKNRGSLATGDPYTSQAGADLDARIHQHFMKAAGPADPAACPRYSTEIREAKKVLGRLKVVYGRPVVLGRTSLADRMWFVRVMTDSHRGTEVLASSLPLAICRLALLHLSQVAA